MTSVISVSLTPGHSGIEALVDADNEVVEDDNESSEALDAEELLTTDELLLSREELLDTERLLLEADGMLLEAEEVLLKNEELTLVPMDEVDKDTVGELLGDTLVERTEDDTDIEDAKLGIEGGKLEGLDVVASVVVILDNDSDVVVLRKLVVIPLLIIARVPVPV